MTYQKILKWYHSKLKVWGQQFTDDTSNIIEENIAGKFMDVMAMFELTLGQNRFVTSKHRYVIRSKLVSMSIVLPHPNSPQPHPPNKQIKQMHVIYYSSYKIKKRQIHREICSA